MPQVSAHPASAARGRQRRSPADGSGDALQSLELRVIWRTMRQQSPAFWATFLYVFFEYVRPQSIYSWLDVAPWPKLFLFAAVGLTVLEGRLRFKSKALWGSVALFTLVIVASSLTAQYPASSWDSKDFWINWLLLMLIVGGGVRTRSEFLLQLLGFVLWNMKMSQHGVQAWIGSGFSFVAWGVSGGPGWFQNSGEFGIEMCVFLPIAGYLTLGVWPRLSKNRRLIMLAIAASGLISIVASSSRGALLGAGIIAAWVVWRSPYRLRAIVIMVPLAALTWIVLPEGNKARWREAGTDEDSVRRLTYWKDGIEIAKAHPVLGIGYRNWIPYYQQRYNPEGELPHNYLIEAVSELGFTGLFVFVGMTGAFFWQNAQSRRRVSARSKTPDRVLWAMTYGLDGAMIGFLASGFFITVLYYPYYWMNMALAMSLARITSDTGGVRHAQRGKAFRGAAGLAGGSRMAMGLSGGADEAAIR
ncbi:MAG: O-antigen ligase family protein [Gemmatimonadota bacterium]|nr:O-antigen ligase family protein [Gemmatimonadota bacterium]MDQ8173188.1 O-antigen ligase family protein [Gemmatimonadota bacterium]